MPAWNELLRQAREGTDLTRARLTELSGISEDTIFSYEAGRRNPRRETILQLTRALKLDGATTNEILIAAALEPEPSPWIREARVRARPLSVLQTELDSYSWPCLALDERFEILAWNRPATRVAELDFAAALPLPHQRNLLRVAAMQHFRQRLRNWDQVVSILVGMYKDHHLGREDLIEGSPYFQSVVADIAAQDGDIMARLMDLWARTPPRPPVMRTLFRVEWQVSDGTLLTFNALVSAWDEFDAVALNDWNPADAVTWAWLANRP